MGFMRGSQHARRWRNFFAALSAAVMAAACSHNDRLYPFERGPVDAGTSFDNGTNCYMAPAQAQWRRDSKRKRAAAKDAYNVEPHVIAVNRDGDLRAAYYADCSLKFEDHFRKITSHWAAYAQDPRGFAPASGAHPCTQAGVPSTPDKHKLLIFVYGGRVSHQVGVETAESRAPHILCDPSAQDRHYPVFMVFETQDVLTYLEQILWIQDGVKSPTPDFVRAPIKVVSDAGSGLFRAPLVYLRSSDRFWDLRVNPVLGPNKTSAYAAVDTGQKNVFDLYPNDPHVLTGTATSFGEANNVLYPQDGNWGKAGANPNARAVRAGFIIRYPLLTIPSGFITPLLDGFGRTAWGNMQRRAVNAARRPAEFNRDQQRAQEMSGLWDGQGDNWLYEPIRSEMDKYPEGTGGFAKFFAGLQDCFAWRNGTLPTDQQAPRDMCGPLFDPASSDKKEIEINIVAHSTGAIVLNNLLPRFRDLPIGNIVYMGGAASVRDTAKSISPLLVNQSTDDTTRSLPVFYNLMLHPKAETLEQYVNGLVPEGSLLEWIDEFLGDSRTVGHKTVGKWRNVREAKHLFPDVAQKRTVFRVYSANNRPQDLDPSNECLYFTDDHEALDHGFDDKGRCYPIMHGEFENFAYWRRDFWRGPKPLPFE